MQRVSFVLLIYGIYALAAPDPMIAVITFPMLAATTFNLWRVRSDYITADDVLHFIIFLFLVVSPLQNFDSGYFRVSPVAQVQFSYVQLAEAQLIAFLFYVPFSVTLGIFRSRHRPVSAEYEIHSSRSMAFAIISVVALSLYIPAVGGIGNMLASRYFKDNSETSVLSLAFLAVQVVSVIIVALCLVGRRRTSFIHIFPLALAAAGLLLSQNPYNTARNFLLQAWLPLILISIRGRVRATYFYVFVIFAIVVLMPIVNLTSREGYTLANSLEMFDFATSLQQPFSDVFDMLAYEVKWFETSEFQLGRKTLGLLLFFVPRALWTEKATLTGLDLGNQLYNYKVAGTFNLSLFVAGDFYADAGLIGCVLGGILAGAIVYLAIYRNDYRLNGHPVKEYMFLAALPILIRGPLGANVGLFFFEMISLAAIATIAARKVEAR